MFLLNHGQFSGVAGAGETACQAHAKREKASSTRLPGRVIPECDSAGNYMPKQCHSDKTVSGKQWCGCWAANGDIIANASTKIKQCNCMLEKDSKTKSKGKLIILFLKKKYLSFCVYTFFYLFSFSEPQF